jgi:hypothetical protein
MQISGLDRNPIAIDVHFPCPLKYANNFIDGSVKMAANRTPEG